MSRRIPTATFAAFAIIPFFIALPGVSLRRWRESDDAPHHRRTSASLQRGISGGAHEIAVSRSVIEREASVDVASPVGAAGETAVRLMARGKIAGEQGVQVETPAGVVPGTRGERGEAGPRGEKLGVDLTLQRGEGIHNSVAVDVGEAMV